MPLRTVDIAGRTIGPGHPCLVIAEAGVNHNGSRDMARRLVDVAAHAQADVVKFQTFKAERVVTSDAPKAAYQLRTTDAAESQYDMLRRLELSPEAHHEVAGYCQGKGILFLSSPFDEESADFLETLGVPAFKIPSGEITNLPFLEHAARKGRPIILSTGMSTLDEVGTAVDTIYRTGNRDLVLLHCVSAYPADPHDVNLRAMATMEAAFGIPVGYSDHTLGIEVALAAVALGAPVIEKHFTLDRHLPGPDHCASLEPDELRRLVEGVRTVEAALGHGRKEPVSCEAATALVSRKSLVAARPIRAGTMITRELIVMKCPGSGLPPAMLGRIVGRAATQDIPADALLSLGMVE